MKTCTKCGAERETGKHCAACNKARSATWRKEHPNAKSEWDQANGDKVAAHRATYRRKHRSKCLAQSTAWRKSNKDRYTTNIKGWRESNVDKHRVYVNSATAKHRAAKLRATPGWANPFFIQEAYALAALRTKVTGFEWHVDHTVPLNSKLVCGLHCEANLAVIPAATNQAKSNRYWTDMP